MSTNPSHRPSVLVLGAGIQGVCAALALEREGYAVTLIDQAAECMTRASLHNEGKIHLGFVYAKDETMRTAALMLRAALRFGPLIEKFVGCGLAWEEFRSRPFDYLVRDDSMMSPEQILENYQRLALLYEEERSNPELHYLGLRPERLFRPKSVADYEGRIHPERALAAIATAETPLRVQAFRKVLQNHLLANENIDTVFRHRVESVERATAGFRVESTGPDGTTRCREADSVVNCLWEGRLKLDEQMGLLPHRRWVYRLKYRLFADLPEPLWSLPSLTMVLGPYGDVVTTDAAGPAYLSWYPASMRGWSSEVSPPPAWQLACDGFAGGEESDVISREILEGFEDVVPGIVQSRPINLAAGVIFSWGDSDIDDPVSELHRRHEIGVESHDGYFSINTGKFTCAPLFADELVRNHFGAALLP